MEHPPSRLHNAWHQIRARPRLVVATLSGTLAYFLVPPTFAPSTRVLVTWDAGAGIYLILAWVMMARASVEHMRWRARVQDDGAAVVLFLTVAGAVASLAAILIELSGLKALPPVRQGLHVGLAAVTLIASWFLVHTAFALHYAHTYYVSLGKDGAGPLEFPRQQAPVYMDFIYFSMVIGMTSQTADIAIATTRLRRLAMAHGLIAFVFNMTLLAMSINIAAGLLA